MNGSEIPSTALPGPNGRLGAARLALGPGLCGAPLPAAGQAEAPSKAAAFVTGGLLGTTASSLELAGACATRLIAADDLESYECAIYGAAVGVVPALSSGFGRTCRDHASLRTGGCARLPTARSAVCSRPSPSPGSSPTGPPRVTSSRLAHSGEPASGS